MQGRQQVGIIYGKVSSTGFDLAVADPGLRRLDYVEVQEDGRRILGQVESLERRTSLSFDEAMSIPAGHAADTDDRVAATVRVIGFRDRRGLVQVPRTPFRAGTPVLRADEQLVAVVLGLEQGPDAGAYLGHVKGSRIPVALSMDILAQKHLSVLAKTGAGKSYTVGVVLEEFLKAQVPLVILDPHGEYGTLRSPNMEENELDAMVRFGIKPRTFQKHIQEFALDTRLNPEAKRLVLEGVNLEGRDIVDMLGGRLSGGQVGVLYQAVKEVKEHSPAYTLKDVMDGVGRNKSSAKWNVLNALEVLESTGIFGVRGTPVSDLVKPGQCTILNLKGVAPDLQDIVVTRISHLLWDARKKGNVPAHILVVEEAHNFCPERNVGNAVSGAVLRTVASEGRKFGLGLVIVSQRPAKIDKNVLSQCNTQIVLKVTNPNDLKAIGQSVENITSETVDEIQRLPIGVALVAGGGLTQPVFVDVRPRMTRHGGHSVSVLQPHDEAAKEIPTVDLSGTTDSPDEAAGDAAAARPASSVAPSSAQDLPDPRGPPLQPPQPSPAAVPRSLEPVPETPRQIATPPPDVGGTQPAAPRFTVHRPRLDIIDEEPKTVRHWSASDAQAIHRVANRIGIVAAGTPAQRTVQVVRRLALQNGRDPDQRLSLYRDIAADACQEDEPACVRCPVQAQCHHHRVLQQERRRTRNPVRRLWHR